MSAARETEAWRVCYKPRMKRAFRFYACLFAAAVALFIIYVLIPEGWGGDESLLFKEAILLLALASAVATWGAGVHIASVYRVVWPLALTTLAVCAPILFLLIRYGLTH
jgi:hypothetical protein